jgi:signal transduction histidine kinase
MHIHKIIVVSRPAPTNPTKEFKVFNKIGETLGTLPAESAINPFFNSRHAVLPRNQVPNPIADALSPFSKEVQVIIPLYSPEGFEGLLALGKRDSEASYSAQDLELLDTVAATVGVFLDRMRPYERIQNEFNRNQKHLYDLERQIARSEKIASVMLAIKAFNHELKTPLSITRMMIDQLPANDPTLQPFKADALEQIDRAITIIRQSLSLSGPTARTVSNVDLHEIVKNSVKILPTRITLTLDIDDIPLIIGSKDDLIILVNNLIKNAYESIAADGAITIRGQIDVEHILITISDSGCGIPADELPKIWDPFFVGHAKRTEGHGLGLSIAFRVVREHLGQLSVESQFGRGSTFFVRLPIG